MAIKIIKPGKETFKAICPICECEFSYQVEDLKEDVFSNHYVECPDCKTTIIHEYESKKKSLDNSFDLDKSIYETFIKDKQIK